MSAICGFFRHEGGAAHREVITAMTSALSHRGPDAAGVWAEGTVALGHRMLHTTRESMRETQPLVCEDGARVLVADARIDNRRELGSILGIRQPDRVGDGRLILGAYGRWGADCARHLIGDFAFAIWNRRSGELFCARDPMGVKPFYYHRSPRLFAFASEIKALFHVPGVPRVIDDGAVAGYLACLHDDRESTLYRRISRLPAAHAMTVTRAKCARTEYWRFDDAREVRYPHDGQYVEAFAEVFEEAVRARLRSEGPVGATLSGGLDSSSVVCKARQLSTGLTVPTFSLVFPSLPPEELKLIDERSYIDSVLRTPGLDPHFVRGDLLSPLADLSRVLTHLDEPHIAPNLYLHWGLYGAARDAGVRVLLDGFDGDATVSHGFGRLNALMATGDWSTFEAEVRAFAGHRGRSPESVLPHFGFPFLSDLARRGKVRAWLRGAGELARRFTISRRDLAVNHGLRPAVMALVRAGQWSKPKSPASALLRSDLARHIAPALREANDRAAGLDGAMERRMHLGSVAQPLYQLTLEIADKSARAFGVEPRYPFFDRRLIELCLGLPDEQKFADGWPRLLFRRAMEGVLPREVQWRAAKGNLAPNFDRRLRAADRSAIEAAMTDSPELARFMDVTALGEVARNYLGRTGWGGQDGPLLARATMLAGWLETAAANRRSVNGIEPIDPDSSREPSGSISGVRCLTA